MALLAPRFTASLMAKLGSKGCTGSNLINFCTAVASGSVLSIAGKPFTTVDVGTITGVGAGIGTGITGVLASVVKSQIILTGTASGLMGSKFPDVAEAVADALVEEIAQATLSSVHTTVFLGAGTVVPGSILVIGSEWSANIASEGFNQGMSGAQWIVLANAIGIGCALGFLNASGNVTISGTIVTPPPLPGGGVGFGTVS